MNGPENSSPLVSRIFPHPQQFLSGHDSLSAYLCGAIGSDQSHALI
jgi:hypothetical protein